MLSFFAFVAGSAFGLLIGGLFGVGKENDLLAENEQLKGSLAFKQCVDEEWKYDLLYGELNDAIADAMLAEKESRDGNA